MTDFISTIKRISVEDFLPPLSILTIHTYKNIEASILFLRILAFLMLIEIDELRTATYLHITIINFYFRIIPVMA